jgi:prepilin-type N-terminal cleavage/methylation domain-containing protein
MHSRLRGFTLIEMMVALAFLVMATGLLARLLHATSEHNRLSWNRLEKQLAVENLSQRMSAQEYDEVPEAVEKLKQELSEQNPASTISIELQTFESEGRQGWHGIVSDQSKLGIFNSHFWRLEAE